jgi:hypothetical protein
MVYDASVSDLNDAMWVLRFTLPTIDTHMRSVEECTFMVDVDVDVGGMFLNSPLHAELRELCGVDLTLYATSVDGAPIWETWQPVTMGMKSSPYQSVQGMSFLSFLVEIMAKGGRKDPTNIFRWDSLRLNLPGLASYDPGLPWVSKVRDDDGRIAADVVEFVDELRPSGGSRKEAWQAARRVASMLSWLGMHDAPRK